MLEFYSSNKKGTEACSIWSVDIVNHGYLTVNGPFGTSNVTERVRLGPIFTFAVKGISS